jgi:hypothetical protein
MDHDMTHEILTWLSPVEELPLRPYREVAFFRGDIRELLRLCGRPAPEIRRNDLGEYFVACLFIGDVPMQLVGLVPFAEQEFAVVADPAESQKARTGVINLLSKIGYAVDEYIPDS